MGEVSAMGKIHPHDLVAGLKQGKKYSEIGLGTAMGLHIGPSSTKKLFSPLYR